MNTKEAIKLIEHVSWNAFGNYGYDNKREEMIALLKRGEKYEEIVKVIEYNLDWHKPECPFSTPDGELIDEILEMIDKIKQKYFPKEELSVHKS